MRHRGVAASDMTTGNSARQSADSSAASIDGQGQGGKGGEERSSTRPRSGNRRPRSRPLGSLRARSAEPLTETRSQDLHRDSHHHHHCPHHQLGQSGEGQEELRDAGETLFAAHHCVHQPFTGNSAHRQHHQRLYHSDQNVYHHHHHQQQQNLHRQQSQDDSQSQSQRDHEAPERRRRHRSTSSNNSSTTGRRHQQDSRPRLRRQRSSDSASQAPSEQSRRPRSRSECRSESSQGSRDRDRMNGLNLSFCGCGFLGLYHMGVASCLVKHGPGFLAAMDRIAGASAGALVAALLVTSPSHKHMQLSHQLVERLVRKIRRKPLGPLTPGYQLSSEVEKLADRLLPADAHVAASGRLHVSLTNIRTLKNEVVSDFESRAELIEALVASCHIPVYSGARLPCVKGELFCDGGLTDNMVRFQQGRTVTVSPFSGKQDIGPKDDLPKGKGCFVSLHNQDLQVNFNNLRRFGHAFFPPKWSVLQQYFELGHKDASRFLIRQGMYEITKPGDRQSVVYESSV